MPMKTRSRVRKPTRRRAIMRKKTRLNSKVKNRLTFKSKALADLDRVPRSQTYYETVIGGLPLSISAPTLSVGRCIALVNNSNAYDGRSGRMIYLKGLRLRCFFQNQQLRPTVCHVALLRSRHGLNPDTEPVEFRAGFFKRMGQGTQGPSSEAMGFDTLPNGIMYATQPINTNEFSVIMHTRFKLGVISTTGGYSSGELKNYRTLSRYVKINRWIKFPEDASFYPDLHDEIHLCIWSCPLDYDRSTEPDPNPSSLKVSTNVVMVFKRQQ